MKNIGAVSFKLLMTGSYEKEDGKRKSEYGRYGIEKSIALTKNPDNELFEHVIRYEGGIKSDFVLASCSVPVNYDYTRLNVETSTLTVEEQGDKTAIEDNNRPSSYNNSSSLRFFWDSGLLANIPLRKTIMIRDYWLRVSPVVVVLFTSESKPLRMPLAQGNFAAADLKGH